VLVVNASVEEGGQLISTKHFWRSAFEGKIRPTITIFRPGTPPGDAQGGSSPYVREWSNGLPGKGERKGIPDTNY